ncbi:MAG: hypothetical protein Unbinned6316contig1000_9 [Prokaryotic dsDNA virus sp.]|nr:MAG: hypothetical protein Unbinned6316contig1000_9 [Prokaryotic dsDNA virus sp.]|tara:strand:- start:7771 stop:8412 length:642 start_codon:yes stop_codon:yes gene_type:complete
MKLKIKKDGKSKQYNLITNWSDVTLEKWMELTVEEDITKTKEAEETIALLSDLPKKVIKELSLRDVTDIFEKMSSLQTQHNEVLRKVIEIDGVEYGFHPDLSEITLGEYADIETFIQDGLQKNLPEIMAILFRKIIEKEDDVYTITGYDGNIRVRAEKMKKMSAEQVQNALVFFWNFVRVFVTILPLSLMEDRKKQIKKSRQRTSQKNGVGSE